MAMHFETIALEGLAVKLNRTRLVLIADDEVTIADTLAVILGRAGFRTMVAYDGTSALRMCQVTPPDLLISDVMMPGLNGVELALAIQQTIPRCKILLFSGQAATMDLLGVARAAGRSFTILAKPLHPTTLLAWASKALEEEGCCRDEDSSNSEASMNLEKAATTKENDSVPVAYAAHGVGIHATDLHLAGR
jgi:DNA-binding response OmpR family regulator